MIICLSPQFKEFVPAAVLVDNLVEPPVHGSRDVALVVRDVRETAAPADVEDPARLALGRAHPEDLLPVDPVLDVAHNALVVVGAEKEPAVQGHTVHLLVEAPGSLGRGLRNEPFPERLPERVVLHHAGKAVGLRDARHRDDLRLDEPRHLAAVLLRRLERGAVVHRGGLMDELGLEADLRADVVAPAELDKLALELRQVHVLLIDDHAEGDVPQRLHHVPAGRRVVRPLPVLAVVGDDERDAVVGDEGDLAQVEERAVRDDPVHVALLAEGRADLLDRVPVEQGLAPAEGDAAVAVLADEVDQLRVVRVVHRLVVAVRAAPVALAAELDGQALRRHNSISVWLWRSTSRMKPSTFSARI